MSRCLQSSGIVSKGSHAGTGSYSSGIVRENESSIHTDRLPITCDEISEE